MGAITTGTGLVSGIDIASIIDSLIALESAPKTTLQSRIAVLQGQQTALLDINARLLNLKNSAAGFRKGSVFQSVLATSGNADVLDVTATKKAQPGSYQFIVKQLVANSQKLSGGFADANTTPLGLSSMSFEFGKGTLTKDTDLDHLNGGAGVNRGKIVITDTSGAQSTVDLTDAVSINEVLQAINADDEINVSAAIDGDRLVITDNAGGGGTLSIANGANSTMATELGINTVDNGGGDADATAGVIAGARIHYVGANTALEYLNGGKGVLIRENIADLVMTLSDGKKFEVDLGRIDAPIENSTLLSELNNGAGVTIGGSDNPDLTFVDRDGNEYEVELSGVT
ncbi:MAG: hypothetical protein KDA25_09100, partial [Phycisphaerales bacterium]|nr:hypothetical protein [Phycisphaerales bacterium]